MGTRRWQGTALLVGAALLTAAVTGCGGSSSSKASGTTSLATTTSSTTSSSTSSSNAAAGSSSTSGAPTTTAVATELTVTSSSIGPIHIGMTFAQASATGIIGAFSPGCEVASPVPTGASLNPPAKGTVEGTNGKITDFEAQSGFVTSPGGIRAGDSLTKVQAALTPQYTVQVDKGPEQTFDLWFVNVLDAGKAVFTFGMDPKTQLVTEVAVPDIQICD